MSELALLTEESPQVALKTVRVVIADDHTLFRDGLAALLGRQPGIEVLGVVADGAAAVNLARELHPDVLLVDLQMPGMDGLSVLETVGREMPDIRTIVLSAFDADEDVYRAVRAGAAGYCLKSSAVPDLAETIHAVVQGADARIPPPLLAKLSTYIKRPRLTAREMEVLELIMAGLCNQEIAQTLGIAEGTVKAHIKSILAKLEARDRAQAMAIGLRRGLVRPE